MMNSKKRQQNWVVSRLLKYFAGEGLVRLYRGGVEVLDKERLKQIAHGA